MNNTLGRPKKANDLRIITVNLEREMIEFIDELSAEKGISRSDFVRGVLAFADSITSRELHESIIVLKDLGDEGWVAFDPELGRRACYAVGTDPESALDSFLTEEEIFLDQITKADVETTSKD